MVLCKYTEFDPKSVGVNLNQNESNGNFPCSWAWNNSLSWAGFWGGVTGTFSARTTTAERFVFACAWGNIHMWHQACVRPSTCYNDCSNTENEHESLEISKSLPRNMAFISWVVIPPPSSCKAAGSTRVASVCVRVAYSAFCLSPQPLLFSHSVFLVLPSFSLFTPLPSLSRHSGLINEMQLPQK